VLVRQVRAARQALLALEVVVAVAAAVAVAAEAVRGQPALAVRQDLARQVGRGALACW
jgi:hypothetical protein